MTPTFNHQQIASGQDDAFLTFRFEGKVLNLLGAWHKFCVDIELTTSACDQMAILQNAVQRQRIILVWIR